MGFRMIEVECDALNIVEQISQKDTVEGSSDLSFRVEDLLSRS